MECVCLLFCVILYAQSLGVCVCVCVSCGNRRKAPDISTCHGLGKGLRLLEAITTIFFSRVTVAHWYAICLRIWQSKLKSRHGRNDL